VIEMLAIPAKCRLIILASFVMPAAVMAGIERRLTSITAATVTITDRNIPFNQDQSAGDVQ